MRGIDLEYMMAREYRWPAAEIDQRFRPIRYKLNPTSARGRHAPPIEANAVAFALLTLAARRASDAYEVAVRASTLRYVPPPGVAQPLGVPMPARELGLVDVLIHVLQNPERDIARRLEIDGEGKAAWLTVRHRGGTVDLWFTSSTTATAAARKDRAIYDNQGAAFCGHRLVIGGGVLRQLGIELASEDDAESAPPAKVARTRRKAAAK
jgi:hypothetical protein